MKYHFEMHSSQLKSISIYDLHEPKILNKGKAPVSLQYKAFEWVKRSSIQIFLGIVFIIKSFENVVLILFAIAYNFINYERNTINWNYKTNLFWIQIVSVCFRERIDFAIPYDSFLSHSFEWSFHFEFQMLNGRLVYSKVISENGATKKGMITASYFDIHIFGRRKSAFNLNAEKIESIIEQLSW